MSEVWIDPWIMDDVKRKLTIKCLLGSRRPSSVTTSGVVGGGKATHKIREPPKPLPPPPNQTAGLLSDKEAY